jgi:hypothetical protein
MHSDVIFTLDFATGDAKWFAPMRLERLLAGGGNNSGPFVAGKPPYVKKAGGPRAGGSTLATCK